MLFYASILYSSEDNTEQEQVMIGGSSRMKPDNLKLMKEKAPKAKPEKAPKKEGD